MAEREPDNLAEYIRSLDFVKEWGVMFARLVNDALSRSLSGLEFAVGIPGSVGGAISMNAGTRPASLHPPSVGQQQNHQPAI